LGGLPTVLPRAAFREESEVEEGGTDFGLVLGGLVGESVEDGLNFVFNLYLAFVGREVREGEKAMQACEV
jgi:hypothetical protein